MSEKDSERRARFHKGGEVGGSHGVPAWESPPEHPDGTPFVPINDDSTSWKAAIRDFLQISSANDEEGAMKHATKARMSAARLARETFLRYIAREYDVELVMMNVVECGAMLIDRRSGQRLRLPPAYGWREDEVLEWIHILRDDA